MKKTLRILTLAIASFVLFSCNPTNGGSGSQGGDSEKKSLTTRINETDGDIDLKNEIFNEDAAVNKAKTVSNIKMSGKSLTVNVSGVTLKNISDAAIEAGTGIGNGDLTIDGSSVEKLTVLGGGSNSINISNSKIDEISVEKEAVRLNLQKDAEIQNIVVAVDDIKIEATESVKIESITVEEAVEIVTISGGTIESLTVAGDEKSVPTILIKGETTIEAIEVAEDVELKITVTEEVENKVTLPEEFTPVVIKLENKYIDVSTAKCLYKEGDAFDLSNIFYVEEYSDGTITKKTLTTENCTVTGFDSSNEGECTVTIKFGDLEAKINVKIGSSKIKIDLTAEDYGVLFTKEENNNGKTIWHSFIDVTNKFQTLPVVGEKVEVKLQGTVTQDLPALYARLAYDDYDSDKKVEEKVAENIKAGEKFAATVIFDVTKNPKNSVYLEIFSYEKTKDIDCYFENGKGIPSETDHIKVVAGDDGLVITLKLLSGELHHKDNGGDIKVAGKKVRIGVDNSNFIETETIGDYQEIERNRGKELIFYYPFVSAGETCYVNFSGSLDNINTKEQFWVNETVKVTATSGRNLDDYISPSNRNVLDNMKPKVFYHEDENNFTYGLDTTANSLNDLCNLNKLSVAKFETDLLLGELYWNDSEWWGGNSSWNKDSELYTYGRSYESLEYFKAAKEYAIPYLWHAPTTLDDWKKYNNHYCANVRFVFKINEPKYSSNLFKYDDSWSDLNTYVNQNTIKSDKDVDLEAALKAGISKISKDGFITSEEEFMKLVMEVAAEYQESGLFGTSEGVGGSRSVVAVPKNKALDITDAVTQIVSFVNEVNRLMKIITEAGETIDIEFDHTVNLGELTVSQWFEVVFKVADEITRIMNNGMSSNTSSTIIEGGPIPEGVKDVDVEYINGEAKYYWAKKIYSDPIDISDMPDDYYFGIWSALEKQVVSIDSDSGDNQLIQVLPENYDLSVKWNGSDFDNVIVRKIRGEGFIVDENEYNYYTTSYDSEGNLCLIDSRTNEIIAVAPEGYTNSEFVYNNGMYCYWINEEVIEVLPPGKYSINYNWKNIYGYENRFGFDEKIILGDVPEGFGYNYQLKDNIVRLVRYEKISEIDISKWNSYLYGSPSILQGYNEQGVPTYYLLGQRGQVDISFQKKQMKYAVKHFTGKNFDEFAAFLDNIITIKNFYLDTDINASLSYEKLMDKETDPTELIGTASLETAIKLGITDLNEALNSILLFFEDMDLGDMDLPVKAVSLDLEAAAATKVSYGDLASCFSSTDEANAFNIFNFSGNSSTLDAATEIVVKAAVCTKTGKGGIISVALKADTDLALLLETISGAFLPGEIGKEPTKEQLDAMDAQIKKIGYLRVSVSDGTVDTWSKDYTFSDIYDMITNPEF